jgi:hypothetical protein
VFNPRPAVVANAFRGRRVARLPLLLLVAGLAITLTGVVVARPAPALALSTFAARCDGVALRARPSTTATKLASLAEGARIVAVDKVSGGSWRTACGGTTATGSSWYKITIANGKDVRSRFGVSYVYGASSLFRKLYSMSYKTTACDGVSLRTTSSTDGTKQATLPAGTKVTVIGAVSGGSWSTSCAGGASGISWYRINQVNGRSTSSLYGVSAVYAAKGLFTSSDAPTSDPTTPSTGTSVRVATIPALLAALADNTVTNIVVANGTYRVSPASNQASNSLWIGSRFARRTAAVTVRAETRGGVTLDGGGAGTFGGLSFNGGAHHQTWDGFKFANGRPTLTGVITFGGYGLAAAHHITLRNITILPSIAGDPASNKDHSIYFSSDAAHDILIEDYTSTPGPGIASALQFHHSPNVYNVTVRRMHVVGTQSAILMYDSTMHDVLIEDSDIRDAQNAALNAYQTGANVVLRNVTSVNSGGVYYPSGKPAGLTLVNCSLR